MPISIVHLSDIHFKVNGNPIFDKIPKLCNQLDSAVSRDELIVLLVTGDIAFSGLTQEYDNALIFFEKMEECITKTKRFVYICVPGNHDCDFSNSSSVREMLIKGLKDDCLIDNDIYENICSVQENFNRFAKQLNPNLNYSKFMEVFEIFEEGYEYRFNLINTAWVSQKNEYPGTLFVPFNKLEFSERKSENETIITCFHHPYSWIRTEHTRTFQKLIDTNSDFILTGHEHESDEYQKSSVDYLNHYLLANELQNSNSNASGFRLLRIDNEGQKIHSLLYSWNDNKYSHVDESLNFIKNHSKSLDRRNLTDEFINFLTTSIVPFYKSGKGNLILNDFYVEPHLSQPDIELKDKDIKLEKLLIFDNFILYGNNGCGKTTLCKKLIERFNSNNFVVVYIDCSKITSPNDSILENLIVETLKNTYIDFKMSEFENFEFTKKLCVLDNFDRTSFSEQQKDRILKIIENKFSRVILTVESSFVETIIGSKKELEKYIRVKIEPFGHRKRDELYRKWFSIDANLSEEEILSRMYHSRSTIDQLLGKGLLKPNPETILLVLNYENSLKPSDDNSIYGQLYEKIVDKAFEDSGFKVIEVRAAKTCLSTISHTMFSNKVERLSEDVLYSSVLDYNMKYDTKVDPKTLIKALCRIHILKIVNDEHTFVYPCFYYYFLARYFTVDDLNHDKKLEIDYMFKTIQKESNFQTLLFVCYFKNIEYIYNSLCSKLENIMVEQPEYNLLIPIQLVEKGSSKILKILPQKLPDNEEIVKQRENVLEIADTQNIEEEFSFEAEESKVPNELSDAFRFIELSGTLIRNYAGSLDGEKIRLIIKNTYSLSMRLLNSILVYIDSNQEEVEQFIRREILDNKPDIEEEKIQIILYLLCSGAVAMIISRLGNSIASPYITSLRKLSKEINAEGFDLLQIEIDLVELGKKTCTDLKLKNTKYIKENRGDLILSLQYFVRQHILLYGCSNSEKLEFAKVLRLKDKNSLMNTIQI